MRVTERDLRLIMSVSEFRYLSGSQVQQLHFPSQRTADRRLQALINARYLRSFNVPGINERIVCLDKEGIEVVQANTNGDKTPGKPKSLPKDFTFLRHFLGINQFRIDFLKACKETEAVHLLGFIPDYQGKQTVDGAVEKTIRDVAPNLFNPKEEISHTPDGVFSIRTSDGKERLFFLEIDRGTEEIADREKGVLKCVMFYLSYFISGGFKRYSEVFGCPNFKGFRLLFVTTSEIRIRNIQKAVQDQNVPENLKSVVENILRFFLLTTFERMKNLSMFGDVWVSLEEGNGSLRSMV